ncbi:heterokaryon incompatibility protein-domain-containing protein [Colletotrichum cereale]|nr:heterokaryon incompatibility protein-domain-containing protein [Colletotrichum cereale]
MASSYLPRGSGDWRDRLRILKPASRTPSPAIPQSTPTTGWRFPWNKTNKLPGLCAQCSTIDFDHFASPPASPADAPEQITRTLISLFDVMKNQRNENCNFCMLLFEAIALPRHDPFEHQALKDHMPTDLRDKTFETWAKGVRWHDNILNVPHPFGQGRNRILVEQDPLDPDKLRESRNQAMEAAQQVAMITGAGAAGAAAHAALQETNKDKQAALSVASNTGSLITSAVAMMEHKLPAVLAIKLHNITDASAGLLEIRLWGYGSKVQAPLSILAEFNLRVASTSMIQDGGLSLHYGRAIGKKINVERDCLEWLNHCRQHHGEVCAEPDWSTGLPPPSGKHFRLIEIQENESDDEELQDKEYMCKVVQVDIKGQGRTVPEYAALSYVWGHTGAKALNLHQWNVSQLSRRINGHEKQVARTISDAIKVTKRLGIRYLWVDSLCVIQKDRNADDGVEARETQLKQMDSIFGHAAVVIIAAAGEDAEVGLAGISSTREPRQMAREVRPNVNVLLPVDYDKSYGKWDTRGWTLQEKLLSKRMLVFAWNGTPVLLRSPFFNEYAKLLEQYTSREMTKSNDILDGGIRIGNHTLYGLPEEFLDLALLWQPPAVIGTYLTKRANDDLPSWSWAGWEVSKSPSHGQDAGREYQARPGVRYEEPFWVSGNDDMSLRKFMATGNDAEERFRPLVMWFKYIGKRQGKPSPPPPPRRGEKGRPQASPGFEIATGSQLATSPKTDMRLVPVNGYGVGIVFGSKDAYVRALEKVLRFRETNFENRGPPFVPYNIPLNDRHLVCETQVARFRLQPAAPRQEPLWSHVDGVAKLEKKLEILEAEILDESENVVGYMIPTDQRKTISSVPYDLVLLSESQYWVNEKRIDIIGFPLYNVMLVEWDTMGWFATRTGLGKISKPAWRAANLGKKRVILK